MNITEFLEARIAEDADEARQIHDRGSDAYMDGDCICDYPARVLRECEAKRRIIALHTSPVVTLDTCPVCALGLDGYGREDWIEYEPAPCPTLRIIAAIYADHPDHDPTWRQA